MAVPSNGPLELRGDINLEVNGNVTDTNVALHQLSLDAGFSSPDAMSDFYGYTSVVAPTVTTNPVTSITVSSQVLNGCVTSTGGENVSRGFYHGTSTTRTSNPKLTLAGTQGTGNFSCSKTSLSQATTYYNWAFACNAAGEAVGNRCQANTGYPPYTPTYRAGSMCSSSNLSSYPSAQYTQNGSSATACVGWFNPYSGAQTITKSYSGTVPFGVNCCSNTMWGQGIDNFHYTRNCESGYFSGVGGPYSFPPQTSFNGVVQSYSPQGFRTYNQSTAQISQTFNNWISDSQTRAGGTDSQYIFGLASYVYGAAAESKGACSQYRFTVSDIRLKTNINYL